MKRFWEWYYKRAKEPTHIAAILKKNIRLGIQREPELPTITPFYGGVNLNRKIIGYEVLFEHAPKCRVEKDIRVECYVGHNDKLVGFQFFGTNVNSISPQRKVDTLYKPVSPEIIELGPRDNEFDKDKTVNQMHKEDVEIDRKLQKPKIVQLHF